MARVFALTGLVLGAALPACAPAHAEDWKLDARLTTAIGAMNENSADVPAADGLLADGSLALTRTDILSNGLQLTWRGEVRLERDAPSRPAFSGVLGNCPPASAGCPAVADGSGFRSPISPATGLSAYGDRVDEGAFATLEGASLSVAGPWGEGMAGFDSGVATRLDARAPTVLAAVSAFSPTLDPTGLVTVRARNDVTGPSFKVGYMTPRLLGLRLGASYAPEANLRGADFDANLDGPGLARADLKNVWEGAASFARNFSSAGLRLRAALTTTKATSSSDFAGFGDYSAWGAGLELEKGGWSTGFRWLSSDNAWRAGHAGYQAWEAGLVHQGEKWRIGVEGGRARDKLTLTEGSTWLIGASRKVNDHADVGLAWTSAGADLPVSDLSGFRHTNARNDGLILELSVRN